MPRRDKFKKVQKEQREIIKNLVEHAKQESVDTVVHATKFLIEYCKENRPFSYNDYMERNSFETLESILRFHYTGSVHRSATMVDGKIVYDQEEYGV